MSEGQQSTREKILQTSLRLFSEKGYMGATTKEISAESGVAEVTLFRHFPSKEIIFEEMLSKYTFLPVLKEIMPSIKKMPYEKALMEIARRLLSQLESMRDLIKIMHSEVHVYPDKIRKIHHTFIEEIFKTLAAYFDEQQKKGNLRHFDSYLAARSFLGMFFAYFTSANIFMFGKYDSDDTEKLIKEFVGFFVRGTMREAAKKNG